MESEVASDSVRLAGIPGTRVIFTPPRPGTRWFQDNTVRNMTARPLPAIASPASFAASARNESIRAAISLISLPYSHLSYKRGRWYIYRRHTRLLWSRIVSPTGMISSGSASFGMLTLMNRDRTKKSDFCLADRQQRDSYPG